MKEVSKKAEIHQFMQEKSLLYLGLLWRQIDYMSGVPSIIAVHPDKKVLEELVNMREIAQMKLEVSASGVHSNEKLTPQQIQQVREARKNARNAEQPEGSRTTSPHAAAAAYAVPATNTDAMHTLIADTVARTIDAKLATLANSAAILPQDSAPVTGSYTNSSVPSTVLAQAATGNQSGGGPSNALFFMPDASRHGNHGSHSAVLPRYPSQGGFFISQAAIVFAGKQGPARDESQRQPERLSSTPMEEAGMQDATAQAAPTRQAAHNAPYGRHSFAHTTLLR
jgi:hypothetical protein